MRKEASNGNHRVLSGGSSGSASEKPSKKEPEKPESPTEELVRQHLPWLRGWLGARLHGHRRQDVDDLCQDIVLRALSGMHRLRQRERFPAWLYRIANNLLKDYFRRQLRRRKEIQGADVDPPGVLDVEAVVDREDEVRRLLERMSSLPSKYREAMILRHVHDLSYDEIAAILGITANNVQVRIFRARQTLRKPVSAQEEAAARTRQGSSGQGSSARTGVVL